MYKAGGEEVEEQRALIHADKHIPRALTTPKLHKLRTCGDVPDQQGCVSGEGKAMSSASVQDRVSGDLQRQLGLEVLVGQTVGAL